MIDYVIKSIKTANTYRDPFPYLFIENFFPTDTAGKITDLVQKYSNSIPIHYPEIDMKTYPQEGIKRFQLIIKEETQTDPELLDFMLKIKSTIFNETVIDELATKFNKTLTTNKFQKTMLLVKHQLGFYMNPHTDVDKKIFTLIYNIPVTGSPYNIGTTLYTTQHRIKNNGSYQHFERSLFNKHSTVPFLKNSCFIFPRTENSYHGVEPLETDDPRYQLQFNLNHL